MKQLERLLFLQGNRCFFCNEVIPEGEASIEHLVATSNGGAKEDENCVVCCKAVNTALGNLPIKAKLLAVLNRRGQFTCPATSVSTPSASPSNDRPPEADRLRVVLSDLQKRGASRPRRVATLKNTINAVFQKALSDAEIDTLLERLRTLGYVIIEETKVSYALPSAD